MIKSIIELYNIVSKTNEKMGFCLETFKSNYWRICIVDNAETLIDEVGELEIILDKAYTALYNYQKRIE